MYGKHDKFCVSVTKSSPECLDHEPLLKNEQLLPQALNFPQKTQLSRKHTSKGNSSKKYKEL